MMNPYRAQRSNGACFGTLWKQHTSVTVPSTSSWNISISTNREDGQKSIGNDKEPNSLVDNVAANERGKSNEFCVLIGNTLMSFDNLTCFRRGDHPSSEVRIVGASAWNPSNKNTSPLKGSSISISPTFRLVTNAGTHIYCSAQTVSDRDIWLAALHSGLEITYAVYGETLLKLHSKAKSWEKGCKEDGKEDRGGDENLSMHDEMFKPSIPQPPKSLTTLTSHDTLEPAILSPPKANRRRIQQLYNRIRTTTATQKIGTETSTNPSSPLAMSRKIGSPSSKQNPYESFSFGQDSNNGTRNTICRVPCASCGRYPPEHAMKLTPSCPLPQYGMENRVVVCSLCLNGQGVLRHISYLTSLYASDVHERLAWAKARDLAFEVVSGILLEQSEEEGATVGDGNPEMVDKSLTFELDGANEWLENLPSDTVQLLKDLIGRPDFAACRRRSQTLDQLCTMWESDDQMSEVGGGVVEFLTSLHENSKEAMTSSNGRIKAEKIEMKKEALKVGGDMTATVKMLYEYALPKQGCSGDSASPTTSSSSDRTEMLACILEFLLDLCEEGDLSSIAFFWPQICQIHMQMLPATDSESLVRVELFEDFLLTVCVQYSVHLALELVWRCVADLEESLHPTSPASAACQRRRFALLRFVCELESLLFGFDGGWGGGSISLRGMLIPSDHQEMLIKDAFGILQLHRRCSSHHLTRSVRLEKLHVEIPELSPEVSQKLTSDKLQKDAANQKLQIARNAEYYSTQLMFCRRLGDIAEKLFSLDVEKRAEALRSDLNTLNSSGRMGGDPLNQICGKNGDFVNVMHIPSTEGHVFRSKERTPVLLLIETLQDTSIMLREDTFENNSVDGKSQKEEPTSSPDQILANKEKRKMGKESSSKYDESKSEIDGDDYDGENISSSCPDLRISAVSNTSDEANHSNSHYRSKVLVSTEKTGDNCGNVEDMENIVASMVQEKLKLSTPAVSQPCDEEESDASTDTSNDVDPPIDEKPASMHAKEIVSEGEETIPETKRRFESTDTCDEDSKEEDKLNYLRDDRNVDKGTEENNANIIEDAEDCSTDVKKESETSKGSSCDNETGSLEVSPPLDFTGALTDPVVSQETEEESDGNGDEKDTERKEANPRKSTSSPPPRKFSTIGNPSTNISGDPGAYDNPNLSAYGEGRRQVLTTIFLKGMRSSNLIARRVAPAAQRAVQAMDRRRAQLLMNSSREKNSKDDCDCSTTVATTDGLASLSGTTHNDDDEDSLMLGEEDEEDMRQPSEEDECMDSLRLLLIQSKVADGNLSPEKAAQALQVSQTDVTVKQNDTSIKIDDAGDFDPRLAGCGQVSDAVLSALKLWKDGLVTNTELLDLVRKDLQYKRLTLPGAENESKLMEDSNFWGRFSFGERWAEKKARIRSSSPFGSQPGWDLAGVIVKSNDDLRQETFCMQLIQLCGNIFASSGLELWVQPYRILATGRTTGIIEMVRNAMSFDSLKKRPGYDDGGLMGHFKRMAECAADPKDALKSARKNFVRSLAAYSLMSYFFMFKDRHNGNILLDTSGHVIHIDFGFVFGIAPGGSFSLEQSAPFKLTEEMIEVMGGMGSSLFFEFVSLFCCGFLALKSHAETFVSIVEITSSGCTFKCFEGKESDEIVSKLRERFCLQLNKESTIAYAMELIRQATLSYGTKQYDFFQYLSQGIAA